MKEIKVQPTRDFALLNQLANHPDILPAIADDSAAAGIDVARFNERDNLFLLVQVDGQPAGFLAYLFKGLNTYEMHSGFLPPYRGLTAIRSAQKALDWVFYSTAAVAVNTWSWADAAHVIFAAHKVNFQDVTTLDWPATVQGRRVQRRVFQQTLSDWARFRSETFKVIAKPLVAQVPEAMLGYAGMALIMGLNGHPLKGQELWNRAAILLGASPIQVFAPRGGSMVFSMDNKVYEVNRDMSIFTIEHPH